MATNLYHEPTVQFLARMILATREGQQITSGDARRLDDHASFGGQMPTTMPEARTLHETVLASPRPEELVRD
jgi:hypothetical protein